MQMNAGKYNYEDGKVKIHVFDVGEPGSGITAFCCADAGALLFEKQYPLSDGMTYDSYIIEDERLVVMDAVDPSVRKQWRHALEVFLADKGGRKPDYLVVQHLEPDHSGTVEAFMRDYPSCSLVCSAKAAQMLPQFADGIAPERVIAMKEGDLLDIGRRKLRCIMAPMVHWPEVMMTFDEMTEVLFSADAFGTFGVSLAGRLADGVAGQDLLSHEWTDEARRYYINICGKYGSQVQAALKKALVAEVKYLCPLHGPVIDLAFFRPDKLYDIWSRYEPEFPAECLIAVSSLHGNTVKAAVELASMLKEQGVGAHVADLSETEMSEAVSQAFAYGAVVFMSATYDASLVPSMRELLARLKSKGWQRRVAGIVENGSWAPIAAKLIRKDLEDMKDVGILSPEVSIRTKLTSLSRESLRELAGAVAASLAVKA